jgi:hypothetical protein
VLSNNKHSYPPPPPSAAAMRAVQLRSERQLWDAVVRVMQHNAAHPDDPSQWCHAYMPFSSVAAVEKARFLCQRHWPAGLAGNHCVFLHAKTPMPPGFVDTPDDTWPRYALVCVSTTLKVGVSPF